MRGVGHELGEFICTRISRFIYRVARDQSVQDQFMRIFLFIKARDGILCDEGKVYLSGAYRVPSASF